MRKKYLNQLLMFPSNSLRLEFGYTYAQLEGAFCELILLAKEIKTYNGNICKKKDPEEPQEWRGAVEEAIETSPEVLKIALEVFIEDLHECQPGRVLGGGDGQDLTFAVVPAGTGRAELFFPHGLRDHSLK